MHSGSLGAAMFKHALLNLILNGIEANNVSLIVSDTGCGIPKGSLDRVFTPFSTTKEKGAGMGLAIVQKVVVSHGGRISLESEEGRGTTVRIALPLNLA